VYRVQPRNAAPVEGWRAVVRGAGLFIVVRIPGSNGGAADRVTMVADRPDLGRVIGGLEAVLTGTGVASGRQERYRDGRDQDVAYVSWVVVGFRFQHSFGHFVGAVNAGVITVTFVLYTAVYLRLKRWVTGVSARSTLPDTLLFVGPVYVGLSVACRQPLAATLDMLAFTVLLAVAFMRIGCFLSGCCHGKSCRLGVHYPLWILRAVDGSRPYTPAPPFTGQRVLPIQLVESAYLFLVIVLLWLREGQLSQPNGSTLAIAAIAYCTVRFGLEFTRGHRHRPTYANLSESQWLALLLTTGAATALALASI
jgi:prolipoprotein diacylglyceryltransferase